MATLRRTRKIGRRLALAGLLALGLAAPAAGGEPEAQFTAQVDREQVSMDESVSLKLGVRTEGSASVGQPKFNAPDFEVVNEYTGTYVESYYDGTTGRFGMRNNQTVTKVLKPVKTGHLRISGIQVVVGGKLYSAPDVAVMVTAGGAGTPPPRGYGGGGVGLRGSGKRASGPSVMVRAEVDKDHAYKGEQIIVSYYLYRRVRVFNIQVDKYPVLNGFLREDLEMPVLGARLDSERVVVDGVPYERSLLLRYAAYPLQEGKLKLDSTALKYNYYANPSGFGADDEDPFMNFFRQMTPRSGAERSEQVTIEVMPLPEDGKPASFTGGVGDFNLATAVDKYDVRANEAVTLTAKIEGRGNVAAIGEPKAKWPDGVELYDSKGTAKMGRAGVGEKVFEFLLIPRAPGKLLLPSMELSYFDPAKKQYVTKTTDPIAINVGEPAPGSAFVPPARPSQQQQQQSQATAPQPGAAGGAPDLRGLMPPGSARVELSGHPAWRWLYWLCVAAFGFLVLLVVSDFARKGQATAQQARDARAREHARSWSALRDRAKAAANGASWQDVVQSYELLAGVVFDALDRKYGVGARSLARSQLRSILVDEHGLSEQAWDRAGRLLEFAELVRFASAAGAVSENAARGELARWVSEGENFVRLLDQRQPSLPA